MTLEDDALDRVPVPLHEVPGLDGRVVGTIGESADARDEPLADAFAPRLELGPGVDRPLGLALVREPLGGPVEEVAREPVLDVDVPVHRVVEPVHVPYREVFEVATKVLRARRGGDIGGPMTGRASRSGDAIGERAQSP